MDGWINILTVVKHYLFVRRDKITNDMKLAQIYNNNNNNNTSNSNNG